jgi:hypothetical protein
VLARSCCVTAARCFRRNVWAQHQPVPAPQAVHHQLFGCTISTQRQQEGHTAGGRAALGLGISIQPEHTAGGALCSRSLLQLATASCIEAAAYRRTFLARAYAVLHYVFACGGLSAMRHRWLYCRCGCAIVIVLAESWNTFNHRHHAILVGTVPTLAGVDICVRLVGSSCHAHGVSLWNRQPQPLRWRL